MARYVLDITDPAKQKLFDQLLKELDFVEVVEIFPHSPRSRQSSRPPRSAFQ